ncbi:amidohydrolase [Mangrovimicrobium sediminis]|uniref:Amidohydrolase n=1 Tax=Mangrovimicrobium sediminis TaxID=2562682 RepID=A0A4Z0M4M8_9GAMM|nr:amidohydrolase [Haliea sp. SAOS-164]TGD74643.1 amidohydrolase [Haliea sp. SAOS-164]
MGSGCTAIINARIYCVDASFQVYNPGSIVFRDGLITAVGPCESVEVPADADIIDGAGRLAVLPGLVDAHCHASLLKGFSENAQLMQWLPEYQREHQALRAEDAFYACLVTYMEALKGGTTTVLDMYRFMHEGHRAAELLGLRVDLVPYAADNPTKRFFETLETTEQALRDLHGLRDDRTRAWVGLEHITYCSEGMFRAARDLADRYGVSIHTHTSEQREEVDVVVELFCDRPVHKFNDWGILKPGSLLAHCVWLDAAEIQVLADTGTGVAHCPVSNMKLASGPAPLASMQAAGIPLGLGSDGGISNNAVSMWESMKSGSLLQKVTHLDATRVSAQEALTLATLGGAQVLGRDAQIGSLEVGKQADLITVDLWQPHLMPLHEAEGHDPVLWNLVFAGRASDVRDAWVQGEQLLAQGRLTRVDESALLEEIHAATAAFLARRREFAAIPMV